MANTANAELFDAKPQELDKWCKPSLVMPAPEIATTASGKLWLLPPKAITHCMVDVSAMEHEACMTNFI